jgi:stage V sporulation protein SpoVS
MKDVLTPAARKQLRYAVSVVIGTKALIAVRDIRCASMNDAIDATACAARYLVRQALARPRARVPKDVAGRILEKA